MLSVVSRRFVSNSRTLGKAATSRKREEEKKDAASPQKSFYYDDLEVIRAKGTQLHQKPTDYNNLAFGHVFSDHFVNVDWTVDDGWTKPKIEPLRELSIHPGAKVLHYAAELFEGLKAYRGVDGRIRMFRPDMNMERMRRTAARASLPDFDAEELIKIMVEMLRVDKEWVPNSDTASYYIRPTLIGTDPTLGVATSLAAKLFVIGGPVGPYYATGFKPVSLLADSRFVRAFPGGVGAYKMGCNYAPTIAINKNAAREHGCQQIMWLYGGDEEVTEVGTMNIFVLWKNEQGDLELVTPPLDLGLILPGVTRQSLLDLSREWNEVKVTEKSFTMGEVRKALKEGRLCQMFGAGTAAVVSPVGEIVHHHNGKFERLKIPTMDYKPNYMQKLYDAITDIHYGRAVKEGWTVEVD
ncbi:unnamed protein product, partial [Mesorhabditis belari]|uniref:Branched-chain-amino-acid aminotransferase n=1 Tax=Mesorhabditis belari TaxID=2138241 RepID=A0AAF3EH46_9BILA